jgi:hypothetical protein
MTMRKRGRDPDYEAYRLRRRFAAIWRDYERAMKRRQRMSLGQFAAVVALVAIGSFGACWGLLFMLPGVLR